MRVHSLFSFIAVGASLADARVLRIPWVESVVASMIAEFLPAVTYHGPTGTAAAALQSAVPSVVPSVVPRAVTPYWLEQISHQGISAFNANSSTYKVFRNVKDYGAKGDGVTDDTVAINNAMSAQGRCAPGSCASSTTTPAIIYFPAGTYIISSSIIDYYFTQIIGNPNDMPVLKATPNFSGFGLIDGNRYGPGGVLQFGATNVFFRQIRNLILDMRAIPANSSATGIHWPTAQATSLQNLVFRMSDVSGTQHTGLFIESGSGGFMNDLVFYGGLNGATLGNQQFTVRNLTFYNAVTAINQIWDWGWTYMGINIINCTTGLDMSAGGAAAQTVGSVTYLDSSFTNTKVAIKTAYNSTSKPDTAGSLVIDNVSFTHVGTVLQGPQGTVIAGGTKVVKGWRQGHSYTPAGPEYLAGDINPHPRQPALLVNGKFYTRSKPQYQNLPISSFVSVRASGAKGDGVTDDTTALNNILQSAATAGKIVFFDAGTYKVTNIIFVPPGSKIVGESFSVIMGAGTFFSSVTNPQPVVKVGNPGQTGVVEWSDMIVSTQGATAGAILIQWNIASLATSPSGMWDVHTRIGGFTGSNLLISECPTTPSVTTTANKTCIAAFMSMHLTRSSSGLYMENVWLWTADHDIEDPTLRQINVYAGRGLYSSSVAGTFWLVGTSVEHHTLYQYQFANTKTVFMGQIQTETAYYQPNPNATSPFPLNTHFNDPDFNVICNGVTGNCKSGFGLRIINSTDIYTYGAGLYSFFNNYSTTCSNAGNGAWCQSRIFSVEGSLSRNIGVYNLNTIGSQQMITRDGTTVAWYAQNQNGYQQTVVFYRTNK